MASAKKDPTSAEIANIETLCLLMSTASEFKPDWIALSESMGGMLAKNIPRKINSIITPYGFEYKSGRIIKAGEDAATSPKAPQTPQKANNPSSDADNEQGTTAKKTGAKRKAPTLKSLSTKAAKSAPAAKKRKVKDGTPTIKAQQDDEVTRMIKEKMGNGTDSDDSGRSAAAEETS
ncbi:hypothetical protein H2198_006317 [Neophaeococcomyces mojaviensis]|uniref:Uncharacterized protein n=1 Tax=Neophaeococcomyces mojaviensis TaxID=3383035 RepID=A0ACC3A3A9_9EURO|nr:hypothetical protein H2198_006317 [Knufia sp. JES_112]